MTVISASVQECGAGNGISKATVISGLNSGVQLAPWNIKGDCDFQPQFRAGAGTVALCPFARVTAGTFPSFSSGGEDQEHTGLVCGASCGCCASGVCAEF